MIRYYMSDGSSDLDVMVADDVDLDGAFDAVCVDTGETLRIRGWMISELERVPA